MFSMIIRAAEFIAVAGTVSSLAYYALCLWSAVSFRRQRASHSLPVDQLPLVSILKPLRGIDPGMYESFRSHCLQDYPNYEIIFAVSDPEDPAIAQVEQLQAEFPQRPIKLVVCRDRIGANIKVSNLAQMLPHAHAEYLIVNDSDIRVPANYLREVIAPLTDSAIGLVTCLYRGVPSPTLGSRFESLGIATDFCPGVLAARLLERAARESARRAAECDSGSLAAFELPAVRAAWQLLLHDRESLVWRHVATARGLLEKAIPEFADEVEQHLDPKLSPTEWRRAAVSLGASIALDPRAGLARCRALLESETFRSDPGLSETMTEPPGASTARSTSVTSLAPCLRSDCSTSASRRPSWCIVRRTNSPSSTRTVSVPSKTFTPRSLRTVTRTTTALSATSNAAQIKPPVSETSLPMIAF